MIRKGESHSYVEICMYEPQDINSDRWKYYCNKRNI